MVFGTPTLTLIITTSTANCLLNFIGESPFRENILAQTSSKPSEMTALLEKTACGFKRQHTRRDGRRQIAIRRQRQRRHAAAFGDDADRAAERQRVFASDGGRRMLEQ